MNEGDEMVCVILAGGQGTRIGSRRKHKVCFPIAGRPAIVRAIDTYKAAGLRRFLIVVGQMAEQVIATVTAAHPEVTFVFQPEPRGTGHAAAVAIEALAAQQYEGGVMLVMGDKVTRTEVVRRLLSCYRESTPDIVMTSVPKDATTSAGRVVTDTGGRILGVVELADIQRARRARQKLLVGGTRLSAAELEKRSTCVNVSMYVFKFSSLREALGHLGSDNAQGELYLTDTVEHVVRKGRVENMLVPDATDLMAFNTPAELLAVEEVISKTEKPSRVSVTAHKRLTPRTLKPAGRWARILGSPSSALRNALGRIYGSDSDLIAERVKAMRQLVEGFAKRYGSDRPMILCRAPGRLNLMGRHVDHRGGFVNVVALSRETLLAAAPRDDDAVSLRNLRARQFPPREFRIRQLLQNAGWADWMDFLTSQTVQQVVEAGQGDWSHYARAPLLRLQHECRGTYIKGMDCLVAGNIPMGAGLSSSSALVVAFAEAAVALNRLDVTMRDFVDLCGEGEWFMGSRGRISDHAAIRASRRGHISRIGFFPFHAAGEVKFPSNLSVVIAHSGSQAVTTDVARDTFNQRVACFELGLMLLRRRWPAGAGLQHVRDLAPERMKVSSAEIYRALMLLSQRPSRNQLLKLLPKEDRARAEQALSTHAEMGGYDLRGVMLYGIGECLRSDRFAEVIARGGLDEVGHMMRISHDGDRRARFDTEGNVSGHVVRTDDKALARLAEEDADLMSQSGRYACSTEAIDQMVDIATRLDGVIGAQLAGAGLGGCIMILVRTNALGRLMRELRNEFYRPHGIPFNAHACTPVAGAGLLSLQG